MRHMKRVCFHNSHSPTIHFTRIHFLWYFTFCWCRWFCLGQHSCLQFKWSLLFLLPQAVFSDCFLINWHLHWPRGNGWQPRQKLSTGWNVNLNSELLISQEVLLIGYCQKLIWNDYKRFKLVLFKWNCFMEMIWQGNVLKNEYLFNQCFYITKIKMT